VAGSLRLSECKTNRRHIAYNGHTNCIPVDGRTDMSNLVKLLGFTTLTCGCLIGRYREVATNREVSYVEEKGTECASHGHRRNHALNRENLSVALAPEALRAS
jgi:hypothetical protein